MSPLSSPSPPLPQRQPVNRMEDVFFRLYHSINSFFFKHTSPTCRTLTEFLTLLNAIAVLCLLSWFHFHYVTRASESCFSRVLGEELHNVSQPLIRIQVSGIWNQLDVKKQISTFKTTHPSKLLDEWLEDPVFVFSTERAFLSLDKEKRESFHIEEISIGLKADDCFQGFQGEVERFVLNNFVGYDTVLLNALASRFDHGSLFSLHSREIFNLQPPAVLPYWFKLAALCTTLFLFFITTTLVHHTLRETQERMLNFTMELQFLLSRNLSVRTLLLNHVLGSLAFVPIMVGMLFFLFEFYNDQLLAFMVMSIVWVCELYSGVCLRTRENMTNFPRLFFLYFCSFHMYFFLFPTGFSYMALTCCVVFLQFVMWSFFVRHEMPAWRSGTVSAGMPREELNDTPPSLSNSVLPTVVQVMAERLTSPLSPASAGGGGAAVATSVVVAAEEAGDGDTIIVNAPPRRHRKSTRNTIHLPEIPPISDTQPITTTQSPDVRYFSKRHVVVDKFETESQASSTDWQVGGE